MNILYVSTNVMKVYKVINFETEFEPPPLPRWKRQMIDLEDLAYEDNLEKWLESLDVPYFKPIPETKNEIRKYLKLPTLSEKSSSMPSILLSDQPNIPTVQPNDKYIESFGMLHIN